MIDDCSRLGIGYKIILPLAKLGIFATIIFAFLLGWFDVLWDQ